jgi:quercetin dioxygenase-like cupin family protein
MLEGLAVFAAMVVQQIPPVPGGCTAPAGQNKGKPGCFLSAEIGLPSPPATLYWHVVPVEGEDAARRVKDRRAWSAAVEAHGRWWVYLLSPDGAERSLPSHHVAGPFHLTPGKPVTARFMESWFPPGMRTRVHSHSGPEAFYVIDGEQCTETPTDRHRIKAGESYIVAGGAHLQAAPKGRRSVVLILAAEGEPWMRLSDGWSGSDFCR